MGLESERMQIEIERITLERERQRIADERLKALRQQRKKLEESIITRKPYGFMQSSFWVIMMVHVMVCGDL